MPWGKTHCQTWRLVRQLQLIPLPHRLRPLIWNVGNIHSPSTQVLFERHLSRHAHRSVRVCYIDQESAQPFSAQTTHSMPRIPPVLLNWQTFAIMVVRRNTFRPAKASRAVTCIRQSWICAKNIRDLFSAPLESKCLVRGVGDNARYGSIERLKQRGEDIAARYTPTSPLSNVWQS